MGVKRAAASHRRPLMSFDELRMSGLHAPKREICPRPLMVSLSNQMSGQETTQADRGLLPQVWQRVTLGHMIRGFRHSGLRRLHERGNRRWLPPAYAHRIEEILGWLDTVAGPEEMDRPGYGLHRLRGNRAGFWAVTVSRNWRIVFRFEGSNAMDVDLVDYH